MGGRFASEGGEFTAAVVLSKAVLLAGEEAGKASCGFLRAAREVGEEMFLVTSWTAKGDGEGDFKVAYILLHEL
jgi:hypothetical protein